MPTQSIPWSCAVVPPDSTTLPHKDLRVSTSRFMMLRKDASSFPMKLGTRSKVSNCVVLQCSDTAMSTVLKKSSTLPTLQWPLNFTRARHDAAPPPLRKPKGGSRLGHPALEGPPRSTQTLGRPHRRAMTTTHATKEVLTVP